MTAKRKQGLGEQMFDSSCPACGIYDTLMRDLLKLNNTKFRNYIRMDTDVFEELFLNVEPLITYSIHVRDTRLR